MAVAEGLDGGCSVSIALVSPPSLLVSLRLVLSLRLLARSALGLPLSVPVAALVSINGGDVAWTWED